MILLLFTFSSLTFQLEIFTDKSKYHFRNRTTFCCEVYNQISRQLSTKRTHIKTQLKQKIEQLGNFSHIPPKLHNLEHDYTDADWKFVASV